MTRIDAEANEVVLGSNEDLFSTAVSSCGNVFADGSDPAKCHNLRVQAKVRYSARPADAVLKVMEDGCVETIFDEPQRAATPGQSVVWYDSDHVIGGGFIE